MSKCIELDARRQRTGGEKVIEVRKISNTQLDGVNLYAMFYNGTCMNVYARNEKEAEEKAAVILKKTGQG